MLVGLVLGSAGCLSVPDDEGEAPNSDVAPMERAAGVRFRAARELQATADAAFGTELPNLAEYLPYPVYAPFDTHPGAYPPVAAVSLGIERFAKDAADELTTGAELRRWLPCALEDDPECVDEAIDRVLPALFGQSSDALKAPLAEYREGARRVASEGDAVDAVRFTIHAALTDPEFVFEVLVEDPEHPGELSDASIARRIATMALGRSVPVGEDSVPEGRELRDGDVRAAWLEVLLQRDLARDQAFTFHRQWLEMLRDDHGPDEYLTLARDQTYEVISRTLFDDGQPWTKLFETTEIMFPDWLVPHMGNPSGFTRLAADLYDTGGVEYRGILSLFLFAVGNNYGTDSSPTKRGKTIMQRLMCLPVGAPPPDAPSDVPPSEALGGCKRERYLSIQSNPSCAACHRELDGIGFGLERMGLFGSFYDVELLPGRKDQFDYSCPIDGRGEHPLLGEFYGPGELQARLIERGLAQRCVVRHQLSFVLGVPVADVPRPYEDRVHAAFERSGWRYDALLSAIARDDAFIAVSTHGVDQ